MTISAFDQPVTVFVGLGFPIEIEALSTAHAFLAEWPSSRRDAAHGIALNACRAALSGEADAQTAQAAFITFARRHRILGPEAMAAEDRGVVAARALGARSSRTAA